MQAGRLLLFLLALLSIPMSSEAQHPNPAARVALVVGNSDYRSIPPLANPANDGRLIAGTLAGLGFAIVGGRAQLDLDKERLLRAISDMGQLSRRADVVLFFYAGHGIQVSGTNWLVPVSATPQTLADVPAQMVDVAFVLDVMRTSGAKLGIMILDACRNNPFEAVLPQVASGLAQPDVPGQSTDPPAPGDPIAGGGQVRTQTTQGVVVAFATQPGNVALDGSGANSPFTRSLSEALRLPGLDIFQAFNEVGVRVKRETGGVQQPWISSSPIEGRFSFAGEKLKPLPQQATPQTAWAVGVWNGRIERWNRDAPERELVVSTGGGITRCHWSIAGRPSHSSACSVLEHSIELTTIYESTVLLERRGDDRLEGTFQLKGAKSRHPLWLVRKDKPTPVKR